MAEKRFEFLARAKPAGLYRLLRKMSRDDAAVVLAGLPPGLSVQVMAYFPEREQADLLPALREARQAPPERADAVVAGLREMAAGSGDAGHGRVPSRPEPPSSASRGATTERPTPWRPRAATGSPINGPAIPGKAPVSGDPFASPLARAGLLDLIGRAQEKFSPKNPAGPAPGRAGKATAKRPEPREGVAPSGAVPVRKTPRIVGPRPKAPLETPAGREDAPAAGGRRMDGKAILAAILREADRNVRDAVEHDDPGLYRELRGRMFHFDDLHYTDEAALARVFTAAPAREAALALKFASPALRERVLRAVSPGRAEALRDPGPGKTGFDAIERAQNRVLEVALGLQAAGRIVIDPRDPDLLR